MTLSFISHAIKMATSCALVLGTSTLFIAVSAEPAFANGKGSSGRGGTRILTRDTAKELPVQQSFDISSSRASDLDAYRARHLALLAAIEERNVALQEFTRLNDLTDEQISVEYPDGGYDEALAEAVSLFTRVRDQYTVVEAASEASLMQLTGGQTLSETALEDLHSHLGM